MIDTCVYFFGIVDMFISKNYDVKKSLIFNEKFIEQKIGARVAENLIKFTQEEVDDFDDVRE